MYIPRLIVDEDESNGGVSAENASKGEHNTKCFFCGKSVLAPDRNFRGHNKFTVMWVGHETIFMHPNCAELFAIHLIKDVRSGELKFG